MLSSCDDTEAKLGVLFESLHDLWWQQLAEEEIHALLHSPQGNDVHLKIVANLDPTIKVSLLYNPAMFLLAFENICIPQLHVEVDVEIKDFCTEVVFGLTQFAKLYEVDYFVVDSHVSKRSHSVSLLLLELFHQPLL